MSKTIAVHVHYKSLYISLPSSAKQQRFAYFGDGLKNATDGDQFWYAYFEFNAGIALYLNWASSETVRCKEQV